MTALESKDCRFFNTYVILIHRDGNWRAKHADIRIKKCLLIENNL
jgi:hypothetical protein